METFIFVKLLNLLILFDLYIFSIILSYIISNGPLNTFNINCLNKSNFVNFDMQNKQYILYLHIGSSLLSFHVELYIYSKSF